MRIICCVKGECGDCLKTHAALCHCEVAEGDRGNLAPFSMCEIASLRSQ